MYALVNSKTGNYMKLVHAYTSRSNSKVWYIEDNPNNPDTFITPSDIIALCVKDFVFDGVSPDVPMFNDTFNIELVEYNGEEIPSDVPSKIFWANLSEVLGYSH